MKVMLVGGLPDTSNSEEAERLSTLIEGSVSKIAKSLVEEGHEILVCSPFAGSADYEALNGVGAATRPSRIEFHFPDMQKVRQKVEEWNDKLPNAKMDKFPHFPPEAEGESALQHAWLLSQLSAMDRASALIAVGGRIGGSAELLLKLAHSRKLPILPLTVLKGAAARFFDTHRYEYEDILGPDVDALHTIASIENLNKLIAKLTSKQRQGPQYGNKVFVSYARTQTSMADFVEMTLRRRGIDVVRDEASFEPGHTIPNEIREKIISAQTFVALWSLDYASSPWCFDEIEFALDRQESGALDIWFIQLDDTRIVPPRARNIVSYKAVGRDELKSVIDTLVTGNRFPLA